MKCFSYILPRTNKNYAKDLHRVSRDMIGLIWYIRNRAEGQICGTITRPQLGPVVKGMDFRHKNWKRILVTAGSPPTLPFIAKKLLTAGYAGDRRDILSK